MVFLIVLHLNKSIHLQSPAETSPPQINAYVPRHRYRYLKWKNSFKITLKNNEIIGNDQCHVIQHLQQVQSIISKDHLQLITSWFHHQKQTKMIIIIIGIGNIVRLYERHIACMNSNSWWTRSADQWCDIDSIITVWVTVMFLVFITQ